MAPPGQPDYPMGTSRPPPPAPGAGGVGVVRAAGAAGVAPPAGATAVAPSPYGGPPPPPAPGAGGVGIKRRAGRASGSSDPMAMEESSYYGGHPPPPPPGASAIAAQLLTSMLQQTAMAQEAARHAVNEAHLAKALQAHNAEVQKMVIPEAIRPVHNNTIKTMLEGSRPTTSHPCRAHSHRSDSQCGPLECRGSRPCPCAGGREREHTDGETHRHRSAPVRAS